MGAPAPRGAHCPVLWGHLPPSPCPWRQHNGALCPVEPSMLPILAGQHLVTEGGGGDTGVSIHVLGWGAPRGGWDTSPRWESPWKHLGTPRWGWNLFLLWDVLREGSVPSWDPYPLAHPAPVSFPGSCPQLSPLSLQCLPVPELLPESPGWLWGGARPAPPPCPHLRRCQRALHHWHRRSI